MERYTLFCTESQTRKAYELGATLTSPSVIYMDDKRNKENHIVHCKKGNPIISSGYYIVPTAEQMIGWLEEQGISARGNCFSWEKSKQPSWQIHIFNKEIDFWEEIAWGFSDSRKEATLAAIDAALECLVTNKLLK